MHGRLACHRNFQRNHNTTELKMAVARLALQYGTPPKLPTFCVVCENVGLPVFFKLACINMCLRILRQDPKSRPCLRTSCKFSLDDVREFLDLPDSTCASALQVAPGQPFRLGLWQLLLREMGDPDLPFLDELHTGGSA